MPIQISGEKTGLKDIGFETLTLVLMKSSILWSVQYLFWV
jgi:hypothetical protein